MGTNPPKYKQQHSFTDEEIRTKAYEISKSDKATGSHEGDWYAAIESLKLEPSKLRQFYTFLWRQITCLRLTQKFINQFPNPNDRDFALEVVKTVISALGLIATITGAIGLLLNYYNAQKEQSLNNEKFMTERSSKLAEQSLNNERLMTERFSKSVEQLGSDKLEVRLGGIYALERISKDSPKDYWTVMEVLTAFVREHSKMRQVKTGKIITTFEDYPSGEVIIDKVKVFPPPPTDIQAVLTVLIYRSKSYGNGENNFLDLSGANLQGANLSPHAKLQKARLYDANLQGASLSHDYLQGALLYNANLQEAFFIDTELQRALLHNSNLQNARLMNAKLQEAYLYHAKLQGAYLYHANLQGADMRNANLQGADMRNANLQGAYLQGAKELTVIQVKAAKNWEKAHYSPEFRKQLGLPPETPQTQNNPSPQSSPSK